MSDELEKCSLVICSGDMDKVMAGFIIATTAAAMGRDTSMFFTFWGLSILRRENAPKMEKTLIEKMFGWMLPKGADGLKLGKLNMAGLGTSMMKGVMRSKNIDALPSLIKTAMDNGARLIACQMTMEMMGIKPEELIDGVEIGGVATMINEADNSSAALFI